MGVEKNENKTENTQKPPVTEAEVRRIADARGSLGERTPEEEQSKADDQVTIEEIERSWDETYAHRGDLVELIKDENGEPTPRKIIRLKGGEHNGKLGIYNMEEDKIYVETKRRPARVASILDAETGEVVDGIMVDVVKIKGMPIEDYERLVALNGADENITKTAEKIIAEKIDVNTLNPVGGFTKMPGRRVVKVEVMGEEKMAIENTMIGSLVVLMDPQTVAVYDSETGEKEKDKATRPDQLTGATRSLYEEIQKHIGS